MENSGVWGWLSSSWWERIFVSSQKEEPDQSLRLGIWLSPKAFCWRNKCSPTEILAFPFGARGKKYEVFVKEKTVFPEVHLFLFFTEVFQVEVKGLVLFSSHFHSWISPYLQKRFKGNNCSDLKLHLCKTAGISCSLSLILVLLNTLPAVGKPMSPVAHSPMRARPGACQQQAFCFHPCGSSDVLGYAGNYQKEAEVLNARLMHQS